MSAVAQYDVGALLEQAGAHIRGRNRADCPDCKRFRAVSYNQTAFYCHGIGCPFRGGIATLRKRLGLQHQWLARERYIQQQRARERADAAAAALYTAVKKRRLELLEDLRGLNRLTLTAHFAGPDHHVSWDALAYVHRQLPELCAELAILEESPAATLTRFLWASEEERASQIAEVLEAGGITNWERKFVAVS
jgi:hypothetical protein